MERDRRTADDTSDFVVNVYDQQKDEHAELVLDYDEWTAPKVGPSRKRLMSDCETEAAVTSSQEVSKRSRVNGVLMEMTTTRHEMQITRHEMQGAVEELKQCIARFEHLASVLGTGGSSKQRAQKRGNTVRTTTGSVRDAVSFFDDLMDKGVLVRQEGGKVFLQRHLLNAWKEHLVTKMDAELTVTPKKLGEDFRILCQSVAQEADVSPEHPVNSLSRGEKGTAPWRLTDWELQTE